MFFIFGLLSLSLFVMAYVLPFLNLFKREGDCSEFIVHLYTHVDDNFDLTKKTI